MTDNTVMKGDKKGSGLTKQYIKKLIISFIEYHKN